MSEMLADRQERTSFGREMRDDEMILANGNRIKEEVDRRLERSRQLIELLDMRISHSAAN